MRGLAFRRHQGERARGRALRLLLQNWRLDPSSVTDKLVARRAVDRTPCSCSMCGNPRRFTGAVTLQELRAAIPDEGRHGTGTPSRPRS